MNRSWTNFCADNADIATRRDSPLFKMDFVQIVFRQSSVAIRWHGKVFYAFAMWIGRSKEDLLGFVGNLMH